MHSIHYAEFSAARIIVQSALNADHNIYVDLVEKQGKDATGYPVTNFIAWRVVIYSPAGMVAGDGDSLLQATAAALKKVLK